MSINKLEEHINSTREALESAGATKSHLNCFRSVTNKIKKHAAKNGIEEYSSELGLTVIKEYYNILAESDNQVMHHQKKHLVCVNNLNDFLTHGKVFLYHKKRVGDYIIPSGFSETYELYIKHRDEMEMSASTIQGDKLYLERFFLFLEKNGISEPQKITVPVVYDFINEISNFFEKGYVSCIVRSVRLYLRFCYQINVLPIDMMTIIPNIKYNKKSKLPSVYTEDEVKRLLNSLDLGSPIGKRNYAIILLIARSGLRSSDVADLRFSDIDWDKQIISRMQIKTKNTITLPLLNDVGEAIINYLKNGRPKETNSDHIFVNHRPPYSHLQSGAIGTLVRYQMERAGVNFKDRKCGSHALRHTLASRLLSCNVSMPVISEILGHADTNTTMTYLRIDIEQLKACALEVMI